MRLIAIGEQDFQAWLAMRIELYGAAADGVHETEMRDILSRDDWRLWFVESDEGERIGMVEVSLRNVVDGCLSSPVMYVEGLYVIPAQRNKGLGKKLMQMLSEWGERAGYTEMALNTWVSNTKAQRFYDALGMIENERVVEYRTKLPHRFGAD